MNYKTRNKLIEAICQGKNLYIKDTGIAISIEYFGSDLGEFARPSRNVKESNFCSIIFVDTPTSTVLKLCTNYHIRKNHHTKVMELTGIIKLQHLSVTPYESKAGKLLYEKKGK